MEVILALSEFKKLIANHIRHYIKLPQSPHTTGQQGSVSLLPASPPFADMSMPTDTCKTIKFSAVAAKIF